MYKEIVHSTPRLGKFRHNENAVGGRSKCNVMLKHVNDACESLTRYDSVQRAHTPPPSAPGSRKIEVERIPNELV